MMSIRLGILPTEYMSPEDEVNDFLRRAIDASNIDQLRKQNVRPIFFKVF